MGAVLNQRAFEHAKKLISDGSFVYDERDDWSEHAPTAADENDFIEQHGFGEYSRWYLGIDPTTSEDTKQHYKFPYGDFRKAHRCAILSAKSRAGQQHYETIEKAIAHLHGMIEAAKK